MVAAELTPLRIGRGDGWSFCRGPWTDGPDNELIPPDGGGEPCIAVAHTHEYSDLDARFRFKFRWSMGGVRFLFRVQDISRYYALDVPWCGQQNRNRHFWAGIVLADGTPLQRYLHLALIPGICPQQHHWYEARVQCIGSRIRAWIDGRPVADIEDRTLAAGRVGLMGIATAHTDLPHFADLRISGVRVGPSQWAGLTPPPQHWITPCSKVEPDAYQSYPNVIKSKSGALTVSVPFGNPNHGEVTTTVWVRSNDGGRTWSEPEPAALTQGFGAPFVKADGTWACVHCKQEGPREQAMHAFESADEGRTWSDPKPLDVRGQWPEEFSLPAFPSGQPLRLRDGTLLVPVCCSVEGASSGGKVSTNFVFRSTDDGGTWSAPVRCDRNNAPNPEVWYCPANFSEIGLAEAADNVVIGYGRPGPWPYMWQVRSNDGGKSWEPAAFGPFPGYCSTVTSTASGALVAVHRFPYTGANVSYDGGVTWDAGTIIDYPIWANHHAVEVEPDVVFLLYMGHIIERGQADDRAVRLRVTGRGLEIDP